MLLGATSVAAAPLQLLSSRNPAAPLPVAADGNSVAPVLSPDGRFVLFTSSANDLTPGGNGQMGLNLYEQDRASNTTALVSVNLNGLGGGNGDSMFGALSADGRYVVFQSDASDLLPGDTNGVTDIFVRDLVLGTTELISVAADGSWANGPSTDAAITPDGRYVAYLSAATNLVSGDTNRIRDVFVRDRLNQTTVLASVGAYGPGDVATPAITPDGRYVVFFSSAFGLAAGPATNSPGEIYVRDLVGATTTWASVNALSFALGILGTNSVPSYHPSVSDDGRYVAFKTGSTNGAGAALILQYDTAGLTTTVVATNALPSPQYSDDLFGPVMTPDGRFIAFTITNSICAAVSLWDSAGATNTIVSVDTNFNLPSHTISSAPVVSPDGRFVAFLSNAGGLVTNSVSSGFHLFVRDVGLGTTMLVDGDTNGVGSTDITGTVPVLSTNGPLVAFSAPDGSLVNSDRNGFFDVFVRDVARAATELTSQRDPDVVSRTGSGITVMSDVSISPDGRWIAFTSAAGDLVANDINLDQDVFLSDTLSGSNTLVSVGINGLAGFGGYSGSPVISANGRYVAFVSYATNLIANNVKSLNDVFRRDMLLGTNLLVSVATDGFHQGNGASSSPVMSQDGRYVAFMSAANNLASGAQGVFWRDLNAGVTTLLPGSAPTGLPPSMSADGRFVAYITPNTPQLRVWNAQSLTYTSVVTGTITAMALSPNGNRIAYRIGSQLTIVDLTTSTTLYSVTAPVQASVHNVLKWSDDGQFVAFTALTNLISSDVRTNSDIYIRDLTAGANALVSWNQGHTSGANADADWPVISGNGRYVVFRSKATDITPGITNIIPNFFLWDRLTGSNTLLTGRGPASDWSSWVSAPSISANGSLVAFQGWGTFASPDLNRVADGFAAILQPLVLMSAPNISDNSVTLDFGVTVGNTNTFTLLQADGLAGSWITNVGATLTTNGNAYRFAVPNDQAASRFYRIQAN
jgi:Tol biopolymer transport system component